MKANRQEAYAAPHCGSAFNRALVNAPAKAMVSSTGYAFVLDTNATSVYLRESFRSQVRDPAIRTDNVCVSACRITDMFGGSPWLNPVHVPKSSVEIEV